MGNPRGPYRVGLPSKRGCWTCRDRKIACDQGRPGCQNCVAAGRNCQGYGLRLSWPATKSRRSIEHVVHINHKKDLVLKHIKDTHFINTLTEHIERLYLQDSAYIGRVPIYASCIFPLANLKNARPTVGDEHHLLTFFMTTVVDSIIPTREDGNNFWKLLFQLSFFDDSPSSMAVLRAVLSLASLYRYGYGEEPLRLKVAAINSLRTSMGGRVTGTTEIYQHTAVGMLLCVFETFWPSESSFQWPLYVSGAKSMLHFICEGDHPKLMEVDILVLWVHYHDILGKFTSVHWRVESTENKPLYKTPGMASALVTSVAKNQVLGIFGCSIEMINLIYRMSSIQSQDEAVDNGDSEIPDTLSSIEYDLVELQQDTRAMSSTNSPMELEHNSQISQLYRLAGLIYLERVLKDTPNQGRLARWSTEAFHIIGQLKICERPFPIFFVACEARTDDKRQSILAILDRTQQTAQGNGLCATRRMIESMWVQQDLASDIEDLKYVDILNTTISSSESLPTLA